MSGIEKRFYGEHDEVTDVVKARTARIEAFGGFVKGGTDERKEVTEGH